MSNEDRKNDNRQAELAEKQELRFACDLEEFMDLNINVYFRDCQSEKIEKAWQLIEEAFSIVWGDVYEKGNPSDHIKDK